MGMEIVYNSDSTLGDEMLQVDAATGNTVGYSDGTTRLIATKVASLARTDTAAKNLFVLPIGAVPVAIYFWWGTASNAATTATISVGKTGNNTLLVSGQDVKGTSGQVRTAAATNLFAALSASAVTQITGIYAETGTASTSGGPFFVAIDFYVP